MTPGIFVERPHVMEAMKFEDTPERLAELSEWLDIDLKVDYGYKHGGPRLNITLPGGELRTATVGQLITRNRTTGRIVEWDEAEFNATFHAV